MRLIDGGEPEPKDPSELSEEEQEARQTGVPVEEIVMAKTKKTPKPKATKPEAKKKPAAVKKTPTIKAPKAKAPKKPKPYKKKGEKNGKPSKRGPKGSKTPERNASDDGVFGRKCARARKAAGLSQAQLAKKIGFTQPAICNIERGTVNASEAAQVKIVKVLGMK